MNSIEDRLRAATQAQAQTLRQVGPLRVTQAPARRRLRPVRLRPVRLWPGRLAPRWQSPGPQSPGSRAPGWLTPGWLAPVTAAALVVALAVALVAVRDIGGGRGGSPAAGSAGFGVPRYYAAVKQGNDLNATSLVIGGTLTGARLATVAPPRGSRFVGLTGAADDRTFVVSTLPDIVRNVAPSRAVTWYLLRIGPRGGAFGYRLTRLAIPDMRAWAVQGIALSRSGRQLAMTLFPSAGKPHWVLRTYSVVTGRLLRSWATRGFTVTLSPAVAVPGMQNQPLSWTAGDRGVVFQSFPASPKSGLGRGSVRLLDVAAKSGNLIADSRVVWSAPIRPRPDGCQLTSPQLTADGKTVLCATDAVNTGQGGDARVTLDWLAYSTSAPAVARVLYRVSVRAPASVNSLSGIAWSDASGGTMIVEWAVARSITPATVHFGIVSHGRFRPLPANPALQAVF